MSKTYSINDKRIQGKPYKTIKLTKDGVKLLDISFNPEDKEAEANAIKSADMTVIRHGLKYKTRKLKPVVK